MRQVAVAALMIGGEADPGLLLAVQRGRWVLGVAAVAAVDAIDGGTALPLEPEQRADAIHVPQDTNSPAGKTDGADV